MGILSVAFLLVAFSCTNKETKVEKEVVVVPVPTPAPAATTTKVIEVKEVPTKETSITLDKKGVKVESKKVDVIFQP